mmetsp:Transcript_23193/g.64710  ORF Transcript_23193/g.64710 Transcript_23193/m.64710 type:complete len:171 (+) Transcript_23193:157-669(+)
MTMILTTTMMNVTTSATTMPAEVANIASSSSTADGTTETIYFWNFVYISILLLLFLWPEYVAKRWSGESFALTACLMGLYGMMSCALVVMSLGLTTMTIWRWYEIRSSSIRFLGFFPGLSLTVLSACLILWLWWDTKRLRKRRRQQRWEEQQQWMAHQQQQQLTLPSGRM